MESGSANSPWAFESGETAKNKAVSLAKKLGCWTFTDQMILDCLMKKSAKDIVAKQGDTLTLWVRIRTALKFDWRKHQWRTL